MPTRTSSPIPSALEQLGSPTDPFASSDVADLRRFLILVADPRDVRGLRYPALALLCAAVSAVLTGARSLIAISEWITDAPQQVLSVLGFAADPLTGLRPVPHAQPCAVCCSVWTVTRWTRRSARICRPERHPGRPGGGERAGATSDRRRRQGGLRIANPSGRGRPAAGGDGSPRRGPGPAAGRFQKQREPFLRAVAGRS
ncbi:transposase family protein [Streptomyces sp. NPDC020951]|uniref:transposase family protein n=1 Tax=Streptomyces sp. NPDC020951 TaxID=3365104 RepID=UPI0037A7623C